jgi:Rieske Fe-S protein
LLPPEKLKKEIEKTSRERISICKQCEYHSANRTNYRTIRVDAHCTHCGCTLSAKTKCLSCECPLKKWTALTTSEQEEEMKKHGQYGSEN